MVLIGANLGFKYQIMITFYDKLYQNWLVSCFEFIELQDLQHNYFD